VGDIQSPHTWRVNWDNSSKVNDPIQGLRRIKPIIFEFPVKSILLFTKKNSRGNLDYL
jgi:hypothetical protein